MERLLPAGSRTLSSSASFSASSEFGLLALSPWFDHFLVLNVQAKPETCSGLAARNGISPRQQTLHAEAPDIMHGKTRPW